MTSPSGKWKTNICISIPVSQPSVTPILVICQPEVPIQEAELLPPPANILEQEEPYFESTFLRDLANNPPKSFTQSGHTSHTDESVSQAIMLIEEETAHTMNKLDDIISEQLDSPPLDPDIPKTITEALKHPQMSIAGCVTRSSERFWRVICQVTEECRFEVWFILFRDVCRWWERFDRWYRYLRLTYDQDRGR